MNERAPLPDDLAGRSFDRASAARAGVPRSRLRGKDLRNPWRGVHTTRLAETALERCQDYLARLKPGQFFSHATAALLHGLPVPLELEEDGAVHVGAVRPADAPHADGVTGHRVTADPPLVSLGGVPVVAAHEVFCQLGAVLGQEDLVVIADHLLNVTALDEAVAKEVLLERIGAVRRIGGARLVRAVRLARRGSGSPAETRIRLTLEAADIPPAELNVKLFDDRHRYLGKPDLVWREQRVVLEYEGDGHREKEQFRFDIVRYEDLQEAGWRVLRATGDDLTRDGRRRLVARVRKALA